MRATSRVIGISINTVWKLFENAGKACATYHDEAIEGVKAERIQCDEIWSFTSAKQKTVDNLGDGAVRCPVIRRPLGFSGM